MSNRVEILIGDAMERLRGLPDQSVHCCVTSPPYYGLRCYGVDGQIGLEETPDAYVAKLVEVFREVRRVLRDDGTLWLNLGDSYEGARGGKQGKNGQLADRAAALNGIRERRETHHTGLKPKDLIGIPWLVAFALRADGWYLRQDIVWAKPNPMPESVTDRCTKAHEYIFLLSKSARYHYDAEAIAEDAIHVGRVVEYDGTQKNSVAAEDPKMRTRLSGVHPVGETRNRRSVWTVATQPYSDAHFATFPPNLIEPCIKAGCPKGGIVLDPFGGAGTTGLVADNLSRKAILIELNPEYAEMARDRLNRGDSPLFAACEIDSRTKPEQIGLAGLSDAG